jgi:formylglycine-generating enzyme required for sulfatase activity
MGKETKSRPLAATEFTPLGSGGARKEWKFSPLYLGLGVLVAIAVVVFAYLFAARAVIFRLDPETASLSISGLSFHIGNNFLLLPGEHEVSAQASGYHALSRAVEVTEERTQEIELALEPLPGKLDVSADLDDIEVYIDGELAGTAPGLIEEVARGAHVVEFRKHRYFPHEQEIYVEGLDRTESLQVHLEPAWGQMEITSIPEGAEVMVDGTPVGSTPLTTEVLETGTALTVAKTGYKTWERQVSVKAGTLETHPIIELIVADGTVEVTSTPSGAHVSVGGEFQGTTPVEIQLSPLREHRIELFLEGYSKAVRNVRTEPEGYSKLDLSLQPIIGRIQLSISPDDAEVLVDGRSVGSGSRTLSLTAKEHQLTVRKNGYESHSQPITPRPGHDQSLDIRLLTVDQAYWATRPPRIDSAVGASLKLFRPSDTFTLGAPRREPGRRANEAERTVRLERPFYIGTTEITNGQFRQFRGEHSSSAVRGQTLDMDSQPAVNVTWQEAALFCNWLSRQEGLPLFYVEEGGHVTGWNAESHGYRLPTEAEWAFAARVDVDGKRMMFPWGSDVYPPSAVVENYADESAATIVTFVLTNYNDGFAVTSPVGSFDPNHNEMYDMSGNASEWVNDFYEVQPASGEPMADPLGPPPGDRHVIRGASWAKASRSELRLAYRDGGRDANYETGFRIGRYVDSPGARP